jgi:hypothetical protein
MEAGEEGVHAGASREGRGSSGWCHCQDNIQDVSSSQEMWFSVGGLPATFEGKKLRARIFSRLGFRSSDIRTPAQQWFMLKRAQGWQRS